MDRPGTRGALGRACRRLLAPIDAAWLAAFRFGYGAALCVSMLRLLAYGWVEAQFTAPSFHFRYWGFEWVPVPPDAALPVIVACLAALACAMAVGLMFRWSAGLFVAGFALLQLIDATNYLNHYYLALLLGSLLWVSPAGRSHSLDALLRRRGASAAPATHEAPAAAPSCAAAWLLIFRVQVACVYFYAGIGKLQSDWLVAGQPLGIWLASKSDLPVLGPLLQLPGVALAMSWAGFLFDTTVPIWLSWRKTRALAYASLLVFHALTGMLFPIGMFPVIMVLSALVFLPPSWPRALASMLQLSARASAWRRRAETAEPASSIGWRERCALVLGGVYCAAQLLLPLRSFVYGGNVAWHEQGMRWSWRVMLREKNGSVSFRVRSEQTGRSWEVSPARYLTRLQEREMATQPELIVQLAEHVRADFEQRGWGPVSVHADAWVSLNGRRAARMIDPNVDLGRVSSGLRAATWIMPEPPALSNRTAEARISSKP